MKSGAIKATLWASCLLLSACSRAPLPEKANSSAAPDYDPATIDSLMADCLGDSAVSACLCLIEAYRVRLPEEILVKDEKQRLAVRAQVAGKCGLVAQSGAKREAPSSTVAVSSPLPAVREAVQNPGLKPLSSDSPEVCLQDKLASAERNGAVPIEAFERFQSECGL